MRLKQEHKFLCNVITVFVLLVILLGGLYLIELSRNMQSPYDSRAKMLGEFLAKGAFLLIVLDLFLMKISRRHVVEEFTEKVKLPMQESQEQLKEHIDESTEYINKYAKEIIKAYSGSAKVYLEALIRKHHSQLTKNMLEFENKLSDLEQRMSSFEQLLKTLFDRIDHSQFELTNELHEIKDEIEELKNKEEGFFEKQ